MRSWGIMKTFFFDSEFDFILGRSYPKQCLWTMVEAPGFLLGFIGFWSSPRYSQPRQIRCRFGTKSAEAVLDFQFWFDFVFCSSNWVINKPDLSKSLSQGRVLGWTRSPVHSQFMVSWWGNSENVDAFPVQNLRATKFLRWPNFAKERLEVLGLHTKKRMRRRGVFPWGVFCAVFFLPSMPGLGDGFPTFEKREGAVKLIVDLGVLHCFPCCNWCRKKPLGWCRSTGMWELWDVFFIIEASIGFQRLQSRGTDDVRFEVGQLRGKGREFEESPQYVHWLPRFYLQKVCRKTTQALLLVLWF